LIEIKNGMVKQSAEFTPAMGSLFDTNGKSDLIAKYFPV